MCLPLPDDNDFVSCLHKKSWACISSMYFSTVETRSIKLDERLSEKVNVVVVSGAGGKVGLGSSISLAIYNYESTVNSNV